MCDDFAKAFSERSPLYHFEETGGAGTEGDALTELLAAAN